MAKLSKQLIVCLVFLISIIGCSSTPPAIISATYSNDVEKLRSTLQAGADPNTLWYRGPPLQLAAEKGNPDMVALLLQYGADPFQPYLHQEISILRARSLSVVDLLLDAGVPIDYRDEDGETLLWRSAKRKDVEMVRGLLDRGANIHAREKHGWTPLLIASRYSTASMVETLLERGADLNDRNNGGANALWLAVAANNQSVADTLLRYGADLDISVDGETILDRAKQNTTVSADWLQERARYYKSDYAADLEQRNSQAQKQKRAASYADTLARLEQIKARDAELPPEIRRDKYLVAFSNAMKAAQYADANLYAELLVQTDLPVDDSLYYFWGQALQAINRPQECIDKVTFYIKQVGSGGKYYSQALQLLLQAENDLST